MESVGRRVEENGGESGSVDYGREKVEEGGKSK
jgi:hypothetical protein